MVQRVKAAHSNSVSAVPRTTAALPYKPRISYAGGNKRFVIFSGGIPITVTGRNMDSVGEPVMVVTVRTNSGTSVFYQVCPFLLPQIERRENGAKECKMHEMQNV